MGDLFPLRSASVFILLLPNALPTLEQSLSLAKGKIDLCFSNLEAILFILQLLPKGRSVLGSTFSYKSLFNMSHSELNPGQPKIFC